jgi:hypothetical protein
MCGGKIIQHVHIFHAVLPELNQNCTTACSKEMQPTALSIGGNQNEIRGFTNGYIPAKRICPVLGHYSIIMRGFVQTRLHYLL